MHNMHIAEIEFQWINHMCVVLCVCVVGVREVAGGGWLVFEVEGVHVWGGKRYTRTHRDAMDGDCSSVYVMCMCTHCCSLVIPNHQKPIVCFVPIDGLR